MYTCIKFYGNIGTPQKKGFWEGLLFINLVIVIVVIFESLHKINCFALMIKRAKKTKKYNMRKKGIKKLTRIEKQIKAKQNKNMPLE